MRIGMLGIGLLAAVLIPVAITLLRNQGQLGVNKKHELGWVLISVVALIALWWDRWPSMFQLLSHNQWAYVLLGFFLWYAYKLGAVTMRKWALGALLVTSVVRVFGAVTSACSGFDYGGCPVPQTVQRAFAQEARPRSRPLENSTPRVWLDTIIVRKGTVYRLDILTGDSVYLQRLDSVAYVATTPGGPVEIPLNTKTAKLPPYSPWIDLKIMESDTATSVRISVRHWLAKWS